MIRVLSMLSALILMLASASALYHVDDADAGVSIRAEARVGNGMNKTVTTTADANATISSEANTSKNSGDSSSSPGNTFGVNVGLGNSLGIGARDTILTKVDTRLNLSEDLSPDARGQGMVRAQLSNGRFAEIKVLPETASAVAQTEASARCVENNCSLVLKEVGRGDDTRVAYQVRAEKDTRIIGLLKSRMKLSILVDAETGEVIEVNRPWWAFLASENNAKANVNANAQTNTQGKY